MARGDITIFDVFEYDKGIKIHDLTADDIAVAMVDSTITPTAADLTPTWSDYSPNEVSGAGYVAGGESIGNLAWATAAGKTTLSGDDVGWTINPSGPTDCRWGIIYNKDAASDQCLGFVDLGAVVSLQADNIDIEWGVDGIHEVEANAVA